MAYLKSMTIGATCTTEVCTVTALPAAKKTGTKKKRYGPLQLRHYLYRMVAAELDHHRGNGSEWLFPEELSLREHKALSKMLDEIVTNFDIVAQDLGDALRELKKEPIP
jgi:hypothetical protein